MNWWLNILPLQETGEKDIQIQYQNKTRSLHNESEKDLSPENNDNIMLVRNRLSRIYFLKKFFNYPVALSLDTLMGLGLWRSMKIFFSYVNAQIFPIKDEKSLEDFFINRFGRELYGTFFKDYTEKVWGTPCNEISADWGAQRIKGLSIKKAISHALKSQFSKKKKGENVRQKETETSLIERFLYPKYGPGQMWEEVAKQVEEKGGEVLLKKEIIGIKTENNKVVAAIIKDNISGQTEEVKCTYFFSTMPIKQLISAIQPAVPNEIKKLADGLIYRDFLTVGLLLKKLRIKHDKNQPESVENMVKDNWIYIQEREVKVGRLQIFNNWSPYMVADPKNVWIGMEYFCNEGDELWAMEDNKLKEFAINELALIEIIRKEDVLDSTVLRMEKAYPAYFGTYNQFDAIRQLTDGYENLFLTGRNGMHKYNNSDHSMLTAMIAVDNIISNRTDKANIWDVNTEMEYHEDSDK